MADSSQKRYPLRFFLAVTSFLITTGLSRANASPVTFGFEATVSSVTSNGQFESGINVAENDVISGQFTFQPDPGDGSSPFRVSQPYGFSLNIKDVELSAKPYEITASNDVHADVDCTHFDCPGFAIFDILGLDGDHLSEIGSNPPQLSFDQSASGFEMLLQTVHGHPYWSGMDLLEYASIPSELTIWNKFEGRQIRVWFGDGEGGLEKFSANLSVLMLVPEPCSSAFIWFLMVSVFTLRGNRYLGLTDKRIGEE